MDFNNYKTTAKNYFYSNIRNNNENLVFDDNDIVYEILDHLNVIYPKELNGKYYYRTLHLLGEYIAKEKITDKEAIIILINYIDPEFRIYSIYEEFCNIDIIKKRIKLIFGFYDRDFLNLEKQYLIDNNLIDNYSFIKRMD